MKQTFDLVVEQWGLDFTFEVMGEYTPAREAQTYGPPERCYPAEAAEFSIEKVFLVQIGTTYLSRALKIPDWTDLEDAVFDQVDELAAEFKEEEE